MALTSWFACKEDAAAADEANAPLKLGKRKADPEHLWAGLLTLIAGTLSANPEFGCSS